MMRASPSICPDQLAGRADLLAATAAAHLSMTRFNRWRQRGPIWRGPPCNSRRRARTGSLQPIIIASLAAGRGGRFFRMRAFIYCNRDGSLSGRGRRACLVIFVIVRAKRLRILSSGAGIFSESSCVRAGSSGEKKHVSQSASC